MEVFPVMWFRSNSNRPRYNLLGTGGFLTASNQVKQTKRPARHNSRYGRLLSMQPLEPRRLLAVIAAEINLFEDNNGSPGALIANDTVDVCLLYTSPSPRDGLLSRMPSSA